MASEISPGGQGRCQPLSTPHARHTELVKVSTYWTGAGRQYKPAAEETKLKMKAEKGGRLAPSPKRLTHIASDAHIMSPSTRRK
ncbi:hypothetical protein PoMZ_08890 [Pyricularia oryzae]|uniref:Uncharacterized protein n=1 Tax=Pyricularia oryzae TaxID=318829 RepID=A0A4P7NIT7_PYROR|nr:hypothetical protein PoMZ_08890 [Pyricularia oryzae]